MPRKPRIIAAACAVLLLALVAFLFASHYFDATHRTQKLPDGASLTIHQVDLLGTNIFLSETPLEALSRRLGKPAGLTFSGVQILPPAAAPVVIGGDGISESLLFCAVYEAAPNAGLSAAQLDADLMQNWRIVAGDEARHYYDYDFENTGQVFSVGALVPPASKGGLLWFAPLFPRSAKAITFQVLKRSGSNDWQPVAEFLVRNPFPTAAPRFTPSPFPVSQSTNGVTFSLTGLEVGRHPNGPGKASVNFNARASFRFEESGRVSDAWQPVFLRVSDAGGNQYGVRPFPATSPQGGSVVEFNCPLLPEEPWKLEVEFVRRKDFPESELWRLTKIPTVEGISRWTTNLNGSNLELELTSARRYAISADPKRDNVRFLEAPPDLRIELIHAQTEDGRNLISQPVLMALGQPALTFTNPSFPTTFRSSIRLSEATPFADLFSRGGPLDLTFALQKPRVIEFIAQPTIIPLTNGATRLPALLR